MRAFQRGRALCGAFVLLLSGTAVAQAETYTFPSVGWTSNPGLTIGPVDDPTLAHGDQDTTTIANNWLADLADNDWQADPALRLEVLVPGGINQAQVRLVAASAISAVPEPASWVLMVGGFGLAAAAMRRRPRVLAAQNHMPSLRA